jgi:phosphoribosyl 1,2-cyclic phosphodiesterase
MQYTMTERARPDLAGPALQRVQSPTLLIVGGGLKIKFLGTRGEIEARTSRHYMHSALLVSWRRRTVVIDCGADWAGEMDRLRPDAIIITHAHPDHASGLKMGAPCPVYATEEAWSGIRAGPMPEAHQIETRSSIKICGIDFEAFPVEHSLRAPAVGYRVSAGRTSVFYAPDLVRIRDQHEALAGIHVYIGDGASIARPIIRRRGDTLIGHASIRMQLKWCGDEGVHRAIFSHCGSEIVAGEEEAAIRKLRALSSEYGVDARLAYDGLSITL